MIILESSSYNYLDLKKRERDYYAPNHSHQNSPPNSQTAIRNILNNKKSKKKIING